MALRIELTSALPDPETPVTKMNLVKWEIFSCDIWGYFPEHQFTDKAAIASHGVPGTGSRAT